MDGTSAKQPPPMQLFSAKRPVEGRVSGMIWDLEQLQNYAPFEHSPHNAFQGNFSHWLDLATKHSLDKQLEKRHHVCQGPGLSPNKHRLNRNVCCYTSEHEEMLTNLRDEKGPRQQ